MRVSRSQDFPQTIENWEHLYKAMEFFRSLELGKQEGSKAQEWVFRGVGDAADDTTLTTTLDDVSNEFGIKGNGIVRLEVDLLLEFMRRYHLFAVENPPTKGDTLDWLALMRHYGAPCRILDFTFSFLVAAFFALERKEKNPKGQPTIWAINKSWLSLTVPAIVAKNKKLARPFRRYLKYRDGNGFREVFFKGRPNIVYPISPFRLNQRLTVQQGIFLCSGDVTKTFDENLKSISGNETNCRRIPIAPEARADLLMAIYRANMSRATLFPGLDGFALSLWTRVPSLKRLKVMEDTKARLRLNLDINSLRER